MADAAAPVAGEAPPSIHSLPDDCLLAIFRAVMDGEQDTDFIHGILPFVCQRWAALAPLLVEWIHVSVQGPKCPVMMQMLINWLSVRPELSTCLRELHLSAQLPWDGTNTAPRAMRADLQFLLSLPAVSGLERLQLSLDDMVDTPFGLEAWAEGLARLRSLSLSTTGEMPVNAQLGGLPQLERLFLTGGAVVSTEATLPPSLTFLRLDNTQGERLPEQLRSLTNLAVLRLHSLPHPASGYDTLTALTCLKRLDITETSSLPSCLSRLTHLTALRLCDAPTLFRDPRQAAEQQEAALGELTGLEHLALSVQHFRKWEQVERLPTTLTRLRRLRHFVWDGPPPADPALPSGLWLGQLRKLAVPPAVAAANLELLTWQAGQLAELGLVKDYWERESEEAQRLAVVGWATSHPSLTRLTIPQAPSDGLVLISEAAQDAAQQARQAQQGATAGLRIFLDSNGVYDELFSRF